MKNLSLLLLLFLGLASQSFAQWDKVYGEVNGMSVVLKDKKYGFIDAAKKTIVAAIYDDAFDFNKSGYAVVQNGNKKGLIDKQGKVLIPIIYDKVYSFINGYAVVKKDNKYGFVNKSGKVVVSLIYDDVFDFGTDGKATVVLNGRKGKTDAYGKVEWGLSVGDYAHGGIVIKLDKTGEHGIICAIEDVGGGKKYTLGDARVACEEYKGYKGWRMPDYDEMKLMYENRKKIGRVSVEKGGRDFRQGDLYWTSKVSVSNNFKYYTGLLSGGGTFTSSIKSISEMHSVRAVKEF